MKARTLAIPVVVTLLALIAAFPVAANQTHQHEAAIQKDKPAAACTQGKGATTTDTLLCYSNKTCPMTGKPINPKLSYEYKDEKSKTSGRIYTCGAGCLAAVAKNPDKYYNKVYAEQKKAASEAIASQGVANITCPVMGGKARSDLAIEYNGKKVNFCCPACVEKFQKDPGKYLKKLEKEKAPAEQ